MKIAQKYSHLNGEEYLLVHHKNEYREIEKIISKIDAKKHKTKVSQEKNKKGQLVYNPTSLNKAFKKEFEALSWQSRRRSFYVSSDISVVKQIEPLDLKEQKKYLK